jgi:DNA-binding MarR family transcriptional regulator
MPVRRDSKPKDSRPRDTKPRDAVEDFVQAWRRERPDLDPWPLAIFGRLQRSATHVMRATEEMLSPMKLSWEAFSLIVSLRRAGAPYAMRPTDLYRQSLITSGAITNRIDRVEKLKLVRRVADPSDRRGVIVELTAAGKAMADRAIELQFEMWSARLAVLTRTERAQLISLLAKLLSSLEPEAEKPAVANSSTTGPKRALRREVSLSTA